MEELETMKSEFKAVLILLLELLEQGETERAIQKLKEIIED